MRPYWFDEIRGLGGGERWNHSELCRARIGRHTIDAKSRPLARLIRTAGKEAAEKPTEQEAIAASAPARSWVYHGCIPTKSRQPWSFSDRSSEPRQRCMHRCRCRRKREMDWLICFASTSVFYHSDSLLSAESY